MPLGKRIAKITKFYIEARSIGDFKEPDKRSTIAVLKKRTPFS
jgi:hypothetical protein